MDSWIVLIVDKITTFHFQNDLLQVNLLMMKQIETEFSLRQIV